MSVDELYTKLSAEHGPDIKALGWSSIGAQLKRMAILSETMIEHGTVLDVGCGFGDFSMYVGAGDYTGIDSNLKFIKEAEHKYPKKSFIRDDFMTHNFHKKFDYVVGNGVLAYQENPFNMIQRMWDLATNTLAFTWYKATRNDINLILGMCGCEFYTIRHDYLPDDSAIFMHRMPR